MLTSITPLGERGRRRHWAPTALAYVIGSTVGGAMVGLVAGLAGAAIASAVRPSTTVLAGIAAAGCLGASAIDGAGWRAPTISRQVNEDWLGSYRGWVCGLGFGVQLGMGVLTIVTTATVYLMLTLTLAAAASTATAAEALGVGVLAGTAFGLARALPILAVAGAVTPTRLARTAGRLAAGARPAHRMTVAVAVAAALACVGIGALA